MKTLIEMAREAGLIALNVECDPTYTPIIERFAELVRADEREARGMRWDEYIAKAVEAEREACALVCEAERRLGIDDERAYYGDLMAVAIRARSQA